jgi:predicted anti-sigma-YlaC factor YlaD
MKHKTIQRKMLRYLDNELSEKEKVKVQRHLERCETCRDALQTIELMWATERPIERKNAPPFLWTRIAARLQSERRRDFLERIEKITQLTLRPALTLAVLFLIIFSGIQLGNLMTGNTGKVSALSTEKVTDNFGMNYFEILPPGSIDANILALTESER